MMPILLFWQMLDLSMGEIVTWVVVAAMIAAWVVDSCVGE